MILRNPQFSLGQKREISHGLDSGAYISKQALFFERTDMTSASKTFSDEIH